MVSQQLCIIIIIIIYYFYGIIDNLKEPCIDSQRGDSGGGHRLDTNVSSILCGLGPKINSILIPSYVVVQCPAACMLW